MGKKQLNILGLILMMLGTVVAVALDRFIVGLVLVILGAVTFVVAARSKRP